MPKEIHFFGWQDTMTWNMVPAYQLTQPVEPARTAAEIMKEECWELFRKWIGIGEADGLSHQQKNSLAAVVLSRTPQMCAYLMK